MEILSEAFDGTPSGDSLVAFLRSIDLARQGIMQARYGTKHERAVRDHIPIVWLQNTIGRTRLREGGLPFVTVLTAIIG